MKNITLTKSVKTESPKTPGGISKSLLTPCRRVGLSRNWKKAGPSPFVSPLSSNTPSTPSKVDVTVEKKVSRKRKERVKSNEDEDDDNCTPKTVIPNDEIVESDECDVPLRSENEDNNLTSTPSRHIEVPRKKKSKTLLSTISKIGQEKELLIEKQNDQLPQDISSVAKDKIIEENKQHDAENPVTPIQKSKSKGPKSISSKINSMTNKENSKDVSHLSIKTKEDIYNTEDQIENITPVQKSKSRSKIGISPTRSAHKINKKSSNDNDSNIDSRKIDLNCPEKQENKIKDTDSVPKTKSPKELTKECIVVIQKKIFKTDKQQKNKIKSQKLFDSDSDDVPLGQLSKGTVHPTVEQEQKQLESSNKPQEVINIVDEDDDFIETKRPKVKQLEEKATSIGGLKKKPKLNTKPKPQTEKPLEATKNIVTELSDDEDDFEFDSKKTILIRKSYEKPSKPQKAKSTGSITQKDIDDLKARIEAKKKMLLARAMTEDTEELRTLIKKWQKGCQDALMELMELMKTKFDDKQNMDYAEMLSMLKIPADLVGYDADNDCFITPDDATIVLSKFNDV